MLGILGIYKNPHDFESFLKVSIKVLAQLGSKLEEGGGIHQIPLENMANRKRVKTIQNLNKLKILNAMYT